MYKTKADPKNVLPWEHCNTTPKFINDAKTGRIGGVPVFAVPEIYGALAGMYVLVDGHHKREAALRANCELPLIVIESPADLGQVDAYKMPEFTKMDRAMFELMKGDLIDQAIEFRRGTKP